MVCEPRARHGGKCAGGLGSTHLGLLVHDRCCHRYRSCDEHEGVSVRVLDSDMQQGDAQAICERERGRAQG